MQTKNSERDFYRKEKDNNIYFPDLEFSTDNGAMIAFLGYLKSKKDISSNLEINPHTISDFFSIKSTIFFL